MSFKYALLPTLCLFLVSCGGGDDAIYDEYHDLVCKAHKLSTKGDMSSINETMKLTQDISNFTQQNAGKLKDPKKVAKALNTSDC
jgi:hypothetical protein